MTMSLERAALDDKYAQGQRASLIEGYRLLAETEPDAGLFRRLGICLDDSQQFEPAKAAFRRAMSLDHSDSISKRRLARLEYALARKAPQPPKPAKKVRAPRITLSQEEARSAFLRVFPLGFSDPKYLAHERDYKWAAHTLWQETLAQPKYQALLASGDYADVCHRLRVVVTRNKLNLPSTFELMALNNLLTNAETQQLVAEGVHALVYGADFGAALDAFVAALQRLTVKGSRPFAWPIVTLFPFLADPVRHMFVKPSALKDAAARLGFELDYQTLPNALTYARALELARRLMDDLKDLEPRDLIDVQGFVFVTHAGV